MGRLLLALGTTAMISLAVPAHASADGIDDAFLASLRQANITYGNPDQAVAAGKSVCDLVANGRKQGGKPVTASDIVNGVKSANPGFSLDAATKFVGIAANAYCPDQLNPGGT